MVRGRGNSTSTGTEIYGGPSSSRLASRKDRRKKGGLSWGEASPQQLQELAQRVTDQGALVSFSKTKDGGALVIFIKDGQDEAREYAASLEELELLMEDLIETYIK